MNFPTLLQFLETYLEIRPYAGELIVNGFTPSPVHPNVRKSHRLANIHQRAGEILWTVEYADGSELKKMLAPSLETALLKFIAWHFEAIILRQIGALEDQMMLDFKPELTDEELSAGPAPERFVTKHYSGGETRYAIFEAGNPQPLGIFDTEDEAELRLKVMEKQNHKDDIHNHPAGHDL